MAEIYTPWKASWAETSAKIYTAWPILYGFYPGRFREAGHDDAAQDLERCIEPFEFAHGLLPRNFL